MSFSDCTSLMRSGEHLGHSRARPHGFAYQDHERFSRVVIAISEFYLRGEAIAFMQFWSAPSYDSVSENAP
jgi:hypothetical protein